MTPIWLDAQVVITMIDSTDLIRNAVTHPMIVRAAAVTQSTRDTIHGVTRDGCFAGATGIEQQFDTQPWEPGHDHPHRGRFN